MDESESTGKIVRRSGENVRGGTDEGMEEGEGGERIVEESYGNMYELAGGPAETEEEEEEAEEEAAGTAEAAAAAVVVAGFARVCVITRRMTGNSSSELMMRID